MLLDPGGKSALSQPLDLSAKQRDPAEVSSPFLLGDTAPEVPEALPPLRRAELLPLHHGHELVRLQPYLPFPLLPPQLPSQLPSQLLLRLAAP